MNLRLFVCAYGDHLGLYEAAAVRSLSQPLNKAALPSGTILGLYSDAAGIDRAAAASEVLGCTIERHVMDFSGDAYDNQMKAFLEEVKACVQSDATMIMVSPDNFWGDGSLPNIINAAGDRNACIAVPHVRVDEAKFLAKIAAIRDGVERPSLSAWKAITNDVLVSVALETLHPSWADADISKPEVNSRLTGISIRHCGQFHYVSHMLPTVFLARFTARDYGFFAERVNVKGLWDHFWPTILVEEKRYRVIGSSDAVFIAELTKAETHNAPLAKADPLNPEAFHRESPHIAANRSVISVWRGA